MKKEEKISFGTKQKANVAAGEKKYKEVFGEAEEVLASFNDISPDFGEYCAGFIYGDLFQRKVIDSKTRFLAIIASLIGQGNTGVPLRRYIYAGLRAGWTKAEILEVIILVSAYSGFTWGVCALYTAKEAFSDFDHNKTGDPWTNK